jgi:hypothetical protein
MAGSNEQRSGTLAIFGIAILLNLLLAIMILDQLDRARDDIGALEEKLATKQDLAVLRPLGINRVLDKRCSGCHNERRFAATMTMEGRELVSTVARMSSHAKGAIPAGEFERIGAALFVRRCTTCHDESVVSRLLLYPEKDRIPYLREKIGSLKTGFRTDQVSELLRAIDLLASHGR